MPDSTTPPSNLDSASVAGPGVKATRRRLLQGGLAAAPVLMTLISRPVLAQQCTTPSGYVSANASRPGGAVCTGHVPAYWANPVNFGQWPTGYSPTNPMATRFNDKFNPSLSGNPMLVDVLGFSGTPMNNVASLVSAALLNAAKGLSPVLSVAAVQGIWHEFGTTGFGTFSPSSGVTWNVNEIIAYLSTTMS
jgi:hypothetical protein